MALTSAQVRAEVAGLLGPRADVTDVQPLQERGEAAVAAFTTDGRRLVLKCTAPVVDAARTAAVLALAARAGVPVPAVVARGPSVLRSGWSCLVMSHVDGRPWRDVRPGLSAREVDAAHRQLAEAVRALQTVRYPACGELDGRGRLVAARTPVEALRRRADLRITDAGRRALFEQALERTAAAFPTSGPAVLTHDDLHSANVLFAPDGAGWRLSGLLDWDKAWAGPAQSDLARMAFWDDMTGPGFWAVHSAAVPPADGDGVRTRVHQLLWCLEREDPSPRHAADTARLCRQLGLPLPALPLRSGTPSGR